MMRSLQGGFGRWLRVVPRLGLALVGAAVLGAAGCAHHDAVPDAPPIADYRLGRDDLVEVQVWKEPALSATVPVRPDGRITLPMAGELVAEGRSTAELAEDVSARLRRWVPEPQVTVMVHEVRAPRIFVLGEVAHPGAFPLSGPLSVLQATALAGGTTEFARLGRVVVIRRAAPSATVGTAGTAGKNPAAGAAGTQRIRIDLAAILDGKVPPMELRAGDTVYVP